MRGGGERNSVGRSKRVCVCVCDNSEGSGAELPAHTKAHKGVAGPCSCNWKAKANATAVRARASRAGDMGMDTGCARAAARPPTGRQRMVPGNQPDPQAQAPDAKPLPPSALRAVGGFGWLRGPQEATAKP